MFRQDFTCPALLEDVRHFTHTGLSPAMAGLSRPFCLSYEHHWPVPLSLATTDGISLMSVPPGTEMFQFPGFASYHYGFMIRYPLPGGLPHSDIHGSKPARGSPWLFAACHVLHRLLVPRHPPNALIILRSSGQWSGRRRSVTGQRRSGEPEHQYRPQTPHVTITPRGSQSLRHRTRTSIRSLRRTDIIRINSHTRL
jgi:hypothetical protein